MNASDTIFALATSRGRAGVAVVRISGPASWDAAEGLGVRLPAPRHAALRRLHDATGEVLDEALILTFKAGASFTGERVVELHLHGSLAVIDVVLAELGRNPSLRMAEPGEFTRRALENGCLDLAQVEGLADLIDAETEAQRRQAFRVLSGAVGEKVESWRQRLVRAAALIEATIDFADDDVPVDVMPEVGELLAGLESELRREAEGEPASERLRDGFEVAIVGAPNVGKSTLLNYLAGRDAAITSARAGTTRDVIEVRMDVSGLPVTFLDTAGLRDSDDEVERIGVSRAVARAEQADLRVFLVEDRENPPALTRREGDIVAFAKGDLITRDEFSVSGVSGMGVGELVDRIRRELEGRLSRAATITRARHRQAVERALDRVGAVNSGIARGDAGEAGVDILAEDLRYAIRALDSLVGRVDVEELLGEIFASFCIGK